MGCCFGRRSSDGDVELSSTMNDAVTCKCGLIGEKINMNDTPQGYAIKGSGTAIGSCSLECDTAMWEVKLLKNVENIRVGVKRCNKKVSSKSLNGGLDDELKDDDSSPSWFFKEFSQAKVGDVVGVYWDQTDLPMLSFSLNGKMMDDSSVTRIRPSSDMYPAVSVKGDGECLLIFDGTNFSYPPISNKFKMIVCATSLI
eukprot:gene4749-6661_t